MLQYEAQVTSHWSILQNIFFQDLKGHVKMIADFLELKPSEELIEEIANKCEFQTMSKFKNSNVPEGMRMVTDVRDKHIMYRKGKNISTCTWSSADIRLLSSIWSGLTRISVPVVFILIPSKESSHFIVIWLLIFLYSGEDGLGWGNSEFINKYIIIENHYIKWIDFEMS